MWKKTANKVIEKNKSLDNSIEHDNYSSKTPTQKREKDVNKSLNFLNQSMGTKSSAS